MRKFLILIIILVCSPGWAALPYEEFVEEVVKYNKRHEAVIRQYILDYYPITIPDRYDFVSDLMKVIPTLNIDKVDLSPEEGYLSYTYVKERNWDTSKKYKSNLLMFDIGLTSVSDDSKKYLGSREPGTGIMGSYSFDMAFRIGFSYQRRFHDYFAAEAFVHTATASSSLDESYNVGSIGFGLISLGINAVGLYPIDVIGTDVYVFAGISENINTLKLGGSADGKAMGYQAGMGVNYYMGAVSESLENIMLGAKIEYHSNVQETKLWNGKVVDIDYSTFAFLFRIGGQFEFPE